MTSEIKQRIEQIRRGEVPEEYKKIHGDIVPLTWDQISLADCIVPYEEKTSVANQYPVLTSSRKGLMLQTDYYSNRQVTTEDNVGYNIIPFGYITFRSRSDDGRFKFNQNSIIDRGIISYFYPVFTFSDGVSCEFLLQLLNHTIYKKMFATVYKGNIIKNLIMDCQSYTKYRPNETTGGIFVSWRRKEELPTGT